MRLPQKYPSSPERSQLLAYTLVEVMISMSLMTVVSTIFYLIARRYGLSIR